MIFFAQTMLRDDFLCSFKLKTTYSPAVGSVEEMNVFLKLSDIHPRMSKKKSLMILFAQTMLRDDFLCSFQLKTTYSPAEGSIDEMNVFLKVSALYTQG